MMAQARRPHALHPRSDRHTYAEFMRDRILTGEATALHETTVPDGTQQVTVRQFDDEGKELEPIVLEVPKRRLVSIEYSERAPRPSGEEPNQDPRNRSTR